MTLPQLADLHNLREVGGLRTADGGHVRAGVLYRCATPAFVDAEQVRVLVEDLGIRSRVDLRGAAEVAGETSTHLLAGERKVVHLEVRSAPGDGSFAEAAGAAWAGAYYLRYLVASGASFAAFARLLLEPDDLPTLVHCTAGKDRTGTAVAVVLDAVGVLADDIVADYARTTEAMPGLLRQFEQLPTYQERLRLLPAEAFASEPEAMRLLLRLMHEQYGGGRAYLAAQGLTEPELDALTAALVDPGPTPT